jgi:hypothetical protein
MLSITHSSHEGIVSSQSHHNGTESPGEQRHAHTVNRVSTLRACCDENDSSCDRNAMCLDYTVSQEKGMLLLTLK